MIPIWVAVVAGVLGVFFGFTLCATLTIGKQADEQAESYPMAKPHKDS